MDLTESNINAQQKVQLQDLINEFSDVFVDPATGQLGHTTVLTHEIELEKDSKPYRQSPYRQSPVMRQEMDKIVEEQLDQGLIEQSFDGPWAAPTLLVRKNRSHILQTGY